MEGATTRAGHPEDQGSVAIGDAAFRVWLGRARGHQFWWSSPAELVKNGEIDLRIAERLSKQLVESPPNQSGPSWTAEIRNVATACTRAVDRCVGGDRAGRDRVRGAVGVAPRGRERFLDRVGEGVLARLSRRHRRNCR